MARYKLENALRCSEIKEFESDKRAWNSLRKTWKNENGSIASIFITLYKEIKVVVPINDEEHYISEHNSIYCNDNTESMEIGNPNICEIWVPVLVGITSDEYKVNNITQEQKDKLVKYLCMALPYGVRVNYGGYEGCDYKLTLTTLQDFPIEDCKPYLRPMSSMTEEEKEEYELLANRTIVTSVGFVHLEATELIEWFNKKHFDFMGLIPMKVAIEVTEDNNPYKIDNTYVYNGQEVFKDLTKQFKE